MKFPKIIRAIIIAKEDAPIEVIREHAEIASGGQVQVPEKPDKVKDGVKSWDIEPGKDRHS